VFDNLYFIDSVFLDLACVSQGLLCCSCFLLSAFILTSSVLAKRLAWNSVYDMTYLVSSGTLNLNSINKSETEPLAQSGISGTGCFMDHMSFVVKPAVSKH